MIVGLVALTALFSWPLRAETNSSSPSAAGKNRVTQFARVIDDLPLMPGLALQDDKDVLFTSGDSRIAETVATGSVRLEDVYNFYGQSLPQLGWKMIDDRTYERDGETLRIDVRGSDATRTAYVRFTVGPSVKRR